MRLHDARSALPAVAILMTVIVTACSSAGSTPSASRSPGSSPSGTASPGGSPAVGGLLLRIAADGGFVPPGFLVTRVPELSIYTDGRAIEPGAVAAIFPGPPVSPLILNRLDAGALDAIRAAARTAGLAGPDRSSTSAPVADAPTTVFSYVDAAGTHILSIYALGFQAGPGAPAEERAVREAAVVLLRTVQGIVGAVPGSTTYAPEAYRIYAQPAEAPATGEPLPNILDWPAGLPALGSLPATKLPPGAGCGAIAGGQLEAFTALLAKATQITRYRDGGRDWTLLIRPLLPDEARTCP